jgi:hypothetical protein
MTLQESLINSGLSPKETRVTLIDGSVILVENIRPGYIEEVTRKENSRIRERQYQEIADRVREIKELSHMVIVVQGHQFGLYKALKDRVKAIAVEGGEAYEKALASLKRAQIVLTSEI